MILRCGSSGFSYKEWKGGFYPPRLPQKRFLEHYASRLPTVEINNTFFRTPREELFEDWAAQVPEDFRFVLKASRSITHFRRLVDVDEPLGRLWDASAALGVRRGPLLFQFPPNFAAQPERLAAFLDLLPDGCRAAFEFRHESWHTDEVTDLLRDAGQALCQADVTGDGADEAAADDGAALPPPLLVTADWGYLRLRRDGDAYDAAALEAWVRAIRSQPWQEVFVFFKHEDTGTAPRLALELAERFALARRG